MIAFFVFVVCMVVCGVLLVAADRPQLAAPPAPGGYPRGT